MVLGGGPIGCELAQAFARLGSQVTQVEMAPRIMLREDEEVSAYARKALEADGVAVLTGHKALRCEKEGDDKFIVVEAGGQEKRIGFDVLLCAVGRVARLQGFGLEELGIPVNRTVQINEYLQTIYPNILAAGDVAGPYQFTHTAAHQAWYAAVNGLFGGFKKFKADYSVIPWATFIDPEVARVGLNEQEAKEKGIAYEVTRYGIDDLDRAIADSAAHGWVKVLTVPGKDRILGVTIVGVHAGDLLAEYVLAMKHGLGLNKILGTIHTYPTLAEANKYAAGEWKRAHQPLGLLEVGRQVSRLETCMMKRWIALLLFVAAAAARSAQAQFDHGYARWDGLLKKHVRWLPDQKQSRVDYTGFADRPRRVEAGARRDGGGAQGRVRRLDARAADGLPDQRLQRLHGRADPDR